MLQAESIAATVVKSWEHKPDSDLVNSRMLGCFRENPLTRQEFLSMAI
jgi:GTP cyclohydrolase I